jgi:U3 small nucleolar ribonucleoprotein protein IMP4
MRNKTVFQSNLKIIITTSRNPSSSLLKFTKELNAIFPYSRRVNRGNKFLKSLINSCLIEKATDLLLVYENRGRPNSLIICHLPSGPTIFFHLSNIVSIKTQINSKIPRNFPLIIIDNLGSSLGNRLASILKNLFPCSNQNSKKIIIFSGQQNFILFRRYWFEKKGDFNSDILLHEIFPNFDMYLYKISLGLICDRKKEVEWILNPFLNTFKRKFVF